jgi:small ligand-binding sensory domain FIST
MSNAAASRLCLGAYSEPAVIEAARGALAEIGGRVSCAFAFVSADYGEQLSDFLELVQLHGHVPHLVGCSGSGIIGTDEEAEGASGFSLLFLHLPGTEIRPFHFSPGDGRTVPAPAGAVDAWITLANPFGVVAEEWIENWNEEFSGVPCLGGLGSGGAQGDDVFCFYNRDAVEGGVALGFRGGVRIETIVSQGCRPIGEPLTITRSERNFVLGLGSRPAYEVLVEIVEKLPVSLRERAAGNLFAGLAVSEYIDDFKTGDFLVRNLLGADPEHGAVAIGAIPRVGQTLQFQLRDAASADEELTHLAGAAAQRVRPFASLVFACNGRGRHLFGKPSHDARALSRSFGPTPSAGFFCNGEIGPVGRSNFVHGYTASVALFCEAR